MTAKIPLVNTNTLSGHALVDANDAPFLKNWVWRLSDGGYAEASVGFETTVKMHRMIIAAPDGAVCDHINGDRLDNRRSNLRLTDAQGNARNRRAKKGKFKGVYLNKNGKTFEARIVVNKKHIYLGSSRDPKEAAKMYDRAAKKAFGEMALLNFC